MKKTIVVTITKELEIEITDDMFSEESLKEFSEGIFPVTTPYGIFEHAARQLAQYGEHFIEGIGMCASGPSGRVSDDYPVGFKEVFCEVDCEEKKMKQFEIGEIYTRKSGKKYEAMKSRGCVTVDTEQPCAFRDKKHCIKVNCFCVVFIRRKDLEEEK